MRSARNAATTAQRCRLKADPLIKLIKSYSTRFSVRLCGTIPMCKPPAFRLVRVLAYFFVITLSACTIKPGGETWHTKAIKKMEISIKSPPFPQVSGNRIYALDGTVLSLRGVMPPDPQALDENGQFNRALYVEIAKQGANVVRVAVHPERWVKTPDYLQRYLIPVVAWGQELGLTVIIDWHYIGNVATGAGTEMPKISQQPLALTLEFWSRIASAFQDAPNVMFEIFNEPENISALVWRSAAQKIIEVIRSQGATQIIIVGGIEYGKDLSWVLGQPLEDGNLVYATHIYPEHRAANWPIWFGKVSERFPVLVTEWGYMNANNRDEHRHLVGSRSGYAQPLLSYLAERGIGWVACWYDDDWLPPMFEKDGSATDFGAYVFSELNK